MKKLAKLGALLGLMVALVGCGPSNMAIKPDATMHIDTVALIRVQEPVAYTANDFGNIGLAFGAIGGAIAGASSAAAGKTLDQIVHEKGLKAGEELTELLVQKMSTSGYQVSLVDVQRDKPFELIENYAVIESNGADAILDVVIQSIGYATEHPMFSSHWRPSSQVSVALIDSDSQEVLYSEKFMYGYHNPFMAGTDLDAPEQYHFDNNDELFADTDVLVEGIQNSINAVGNEIMVSLQK